MEQKAKTLARLLRVLANETRLLILCALQQGPATVGALGAKTAGVSQSALSQHLALLRAHGIVDCVKTGQHVAYSIADRRVEAVMAVLRETYCNQVTEDAE